jgi:hypothetical protein
MYIPLILFSVLILPFVVFLSSHKIDSQRVVTMQRLINIIFLREILGIWGYVIILRYFYDR